MTAGGFEFFSNHINIASQFLNPWRRLTTDVLPMFSIQSSWVIPSTVKYLACPLHSPTFLFGGYEDINHPENSDKRPNSGWHRRRLQCSRNRRSKCRAASPTAPARGKSPSRTVGDCPASHGADCQSGYAAGIPNIMAQWVCSYGRLWGITGYFYGVIHSINGVSSVLITGKGP